LQLGEYEYHLLDRLETKSGRLSDRLFLNGSPVSRKDVVEFFQYKKVVSSDKVVVSHIAGSLIDGYTIRHAVSINSEWTEDQAGAISIKKPWFNTFYKSQANFYEVNTKDFFLALNPVMSAQVMREQFSEKGTTSSQHLFASSRGAEVRGRIANKIGFYTYFTDNQEQPNSYVANWIVKNQAVPGADYFQNNPANEYQYDSSKKNF
jgi:hypothetical protein